MTAPAELSAAGDRSHDHEWFGTARNRIWQRRIRRFVRKILTASEKAHEWPTFPRHLITNSAAEHRVARLERIEDRALSDRACNGECDLAIDVRKFAQMGRQGDTNHGSVWASTESTGGRSRTMAFQVSPASAEA